MRPRSQPIRSAAAARREAASIKRQYKTDLNRRRRLLPAEVPHVEDLVIILKIAGFSRSQTGGIVGISRGQVREILEKPEVAERLVAVRAALPQAAVNLLQGYMIEAVQAIADVMRRTKDDKLILAAAGEILDRGGVPKASRQERHSINEAKTTIVDDGMVERLRALPVDKQEEAAQIVEGLEKLLTDAAEAGDASAE